MYEVQGCASYLRWFGVFRITFLLFDEMNQTLRIPGAHINIYCSTAYIAFAYFIEAAELLAKTFEFNLFFKLDFCMMFCLKLCFFNVLFELRFRNPKLQLVVLVTIVALLRVYIFIIDTLA